VYRRLAIRICIVTTTPPSIRPPTFARPDDSARARVFTLMNNTVYSRGFLTEICTVILFILHTAAMRDEQLQLRDGVYGSWPKTPQVSSSFLVRCRSNPMPSYARLKIPPPFLLIIAPRWRLPAGVSSSVARTVTN